MVWVWGKVKVACEGMQEGPGKDGLVGLEWGGSVDG